MVITASQMLNGSAASPDAVFVGHWIAVIGHPADRFWTQRSQVSRNRLGTSDETR